MAKVDQLLADSRSIYKDKPIEQRQIELALGQFTENMKKLATNSTAGYLATLELLISNISILMKVSNLLKQAL